MKQDSETLATALAVGPVEAGILNVLLYFDIFSYPLTVEELGKMHPVKGVNAVQLSESLAHLVASGIIHQLGEFYLLSPEKSLGERRQKGNARAAETMLRACRRSRFISKFPFVRSVMISGSLSKNYMEAGSDIDFFVVTQAGRLWIARTLLILYKKIFLFNSHKEFCMNYFIDTEHLEIEDKNIFTATEVTFLLPTYHPELYRAFQAANTWATQYYPNYGLRDLQYCAAGQDGWWKRMGEWLLNGKLGEVLDTWCLRRTLGRWRKKFSHFSQEKFDIALRSRKYVSKHHPSHFQERVIGKLEARQQELEARFGIVLRMKTAGN
jgi:hypothetical protein